MPFLISIFIVVGHVLILVLKSPPTIKVIPEVIERLNIFFSALIIPQPWDRLRFREAAFAVEDRTPRFEPALLRGVFFRWRVHVGAFVDGVVLAALDRVEEDFGSALDAFEEGVVFVTAGGGSFVGVVAKDLFAVGAADLVFGCSVAEFREAEDGVVVLVLEGLDVLADLKRLVRYWQGI